MADAKNGRYEKGPLWPGLTAQVNHEARDLKTIGWNVDIVPSDYDGHYLLPADRQLAVTAAIDEVSRTPDFANVLLNPETNPAGAAWHGIAKRAVALHAFYNIGSIDRPSDGIDPNVLDLPLFGNKSARQLTLDDTEPAKAKRILQKYETFFNAGSLWDTHGAELSAGDFIAGSVDRIADVSRATVATSMIREHVYGNLAAYRQRGVVSASLACGAAEPVFWLANSLEAEGVPVNKIHLVDSDPIALAASTSRAQAHNVVDKVELHRKNIIKTPIEGYIAPQSVDFVDLIGLFEYLPQRRSALSYKLAGNLLADVAKIVRPGGMIVFGNMLDSRPQQEWFEGIWPRLEQRSVSDVLEIVQHTGFAKDQISVRIAEAEGIYALYGIKIPESGKIPTVSGLQRKIGKRVLSSLPEY